MQSLWHPHPFHIQKLCHFEKNSIFDIGKYKLKNVELPKVLASGLTPTWLFRKYAKITRLDWHPVYFAKFFSFRDVNMICLKSCIAMTKMFFLPIFAIYLTDDGFPCQHSAVSSNYFLNKKTLRVPFQ